MSSGVHLISGGGGGENDIGREENTISVQQDEMAYCCVGREEQQICRKRSAHFQTNHKHTVNLLNLWQIRVGKIYQSQDQMLL
eukprot:1840091-Ditylum_brightwellii.AAC.1